MHLRPHCKGCLSRATCVKCQHKSSSVLAECKRQQHTNCRKFPMMYIIMCINENLRRGDGRLQVPPRQLNDEAGLMQAPTCGARV